MMNKKSVETFKEVLEGTTNAMPFLDVDYVNIMAISGVVLLTGFSDNVVNLYGAIYDEAGVDRDCEVIKISRDGICDDGANEIMCRFDAGKTDEKGRPIMWTFETDIPHQEVDIIDQYGDDIVHARALLFNINDLK